MVLVGAGQMAGGATKGKLFQAVQPIPSGNGLLYVYNESLHRGRCEVDQPQMFFNFPCNLRTDSFVV